MFASHKQNAEQNHSIKLGNKSFGNVLKFIYLGNSCYIPFQNFLYSRLLTKNIRMIKYMNKILPVVLYVWYLVPHIKGRKQTKGVREKSVKIFELKRKEGCGGWRKVHKDELHGLYLFPNILGTWTVWCTRGIHTRFSWENQRETDRSEDSGAGGRIIIKHLKNMNGWRGLGAVRLGQNRDKLWEFLD